MERSNIAIVIPAFNESKTIYDIVKNVSEYGVPIVVNDGSTDETEKIAASAGAIVVTHVQNMGYDSALSSGFKKAHELDFKAVITIDADGQHNPTLLAQFIAKLNEEYDLIIGIRDRHQRLGELVFTIVGKLLWRINDPLCGLKAYKMDLYKSLGHFDSYKSIGTELAIYGAKTNKKISQVHIKTRDRLDQPRFGRKFRANYQIFRALLIGIFRQY